MIPQPEKPTYRQRLYARYSEHFGGAKAVDLPVQFRQFEACYRGRLPASPCVIGDLGCGKGEWLAWLRSKGCTELWGVDGSAGDVAIARGHNPGIELVQGDACEALRGRPASFDLLHAKDVIEHMRPDELFDFLDACRAALKPGGSLWLLTYNAQAPFANVTRYGDFTHEIGLTPSSMAQVLSAAGFTVDRVDGIHICPATPGGIARKILWKMMTPFFRLLLKARHGRGAAREGVDVLATNPDLFAVAGKVRGPSS